MARRKVMHLGGFKKEMRRDAQPDKNSLLIVLWDEMLPNVGQFSGEFFCTAEDGGGVDRREERKKISGGHFATGTGFPELRERHA